MTDLKIVCDRMTSTEFEPKYFVYEVMSDSIIYTGTYTQCLCVTGAFLMDPKTTLEEIKNKTNGYI